MSFLKNYVDSHSAKAAIWDAYRIKYPKRMPLTIKAHDVSKFVFSVLQRGDGAQSWWTIIRPEFAAVEIERPNDAN